MVVDVSGDGGETYTPVEYYGTTKLCSKLFGLVGDADPANGTETV